MHDKYWRRGLFTQCSLNNDNFSILFKIIGTLDKIYRKYAVYILSQFVMVFYTTTSAHHIYASQNDGTSIHTVNGKMFNTISIGDPCWRDFSFRYVQWNKIIVALPDTILLGSLYHFKCTRQKNRPRQQLHNMLDMFPCYRANSSRRSFCLSTSSESSALVKNS